MTGGPVDELLRRRDPQGYYVIPVSTRCREIVDRVMEKSAGEVMVEEAGDTLFLRVRSRGLARRLGRLFAARNCIASV